MSPDIKQQLPERHEYLCGCVAAPTALGGWVLDRKCGDHLGTIGALDLPDRFEVRRPEQQLQERKRWTCEEVGCSFTAATDERSTTRMLQWAHESGHRNERAASQAVLSAMVAQLAREDMRLADVVLNAMSRSTSEVYREAHPPRLQHGLHATGPLTPEQIERLRRNTAAALNGLHVQEDDHG